MDLKTLEIKMLLHKYDSFKTELDLKNQKLNYINDIFMKEIIKDDSLSSVVETAINEVDLNSEENVAADIKNNSGETNATKEEITDELINDEIDRTPKIELPLDIKNIFRKIVLLTHPDKLKANDPDRLNKLKLYIEVQKSAQEKKISNILLIAYKLGIDIDIEGDYTNSLSIEINSLEVQIKSMEYITSWIWYYTPNNQLKNLMVQRVRDAYRKQKLASRNNI